MSKINVLDRKTAELIAAGEVVERPASAVKEMVENCVDAGATAVTVEIKNGGNTFIRVSDNGCGIEKDDIKKAFLRHATSKIKTSDDLDNIMTLGFRGEALASIAAVAKVELITKTKTDEIGTKYEIHGGEEIYFDDAGCADGTTIIVRDLFFNTPARQKFLKKDTSEGNAVAAVIERVALSHPEVSFRLIKDGRQAMLTPGDGQLKSAIYAVLGRDFASTLIECDYELDGVKVTGFITKPELSRKKPSQYFFLNGRFINTKTGAAALKQAYKNEIMVDRVPGCVLNICMPFTEADVNVHPAKLEVRFSDESRVFHAVYYAVKSAIGADNSRVSFDENKIVKDITRPPEQKFTQISLETPVENKFTKISEPENNNIFEVADSGVDKFIPTYTEPPKPIKKIDIDIEFDEEVEDEKPQTAQKPIDFKLIGEAFMTYIIVEIDGKLLFIDKHAAHERIIFEQMKSKEKQHSQQLLMPVEIELSAEEFDAVMENIEGFEKLGFEIEESGVKSVLVRCVPMTLGNRDVKDVIFEAAGKLAQGMTDFTPEFIDWLYHSVSCRAAIKGGEHTDASFLKVIAQTVLTNDSIRRCPHGRPIVVEMGSDEIKRRFGRT